MASDLEAKNYYIQNLKTHSFFTAFFRYLANAFATWHALKKEKPEIIFIASPPVFAVLAIWAYCQSHSCAYVVDTHCGTFNAKRWSMFLWLHKFLAKRALLNILHNEPLKEKVAEWGAPAVNLGDIFYQVHTKKTYPFRQGFSVVFVNVYSDDEPLEEVVETARRMPSVNFYITGSLARAPMSIIKMAPENVVFTDFLSDEIFNALLKGGDIILSLTKADLTMQNGVYEAIALGRPVITSDWPVLRKTYRKGVICTDNSSEALFNAIQEMKQNYHFYLREINELRTEFLSSWQEKRAQLIELLNGRNH